MTGRRKKGGGDGHLMVTLGLSHLLKYIHIYTYVERKDEGVKGKRGGRGGGHLMVTLGSLHLLKYIHI